MTVPASKAWKENSCDVSVVYRRFAMFLFRFKHTHYQNLKLKKVCQTVIVMNFIVLL